MMTTGYDCPDLLNLGFCRPVKSPTDYIQMKGRGTRRYEFTKNVIDQVVQDQLARRPKNDFRIIDYFGVCEYFDEKDLYDRLPAPATDHDGCGKPRPRGPGRLYLRHGKDETETITGLTMDAEGSITSRIEILEQREASNRTLADEFARYLELHPVSDDYEREDVQRLFEAYATDEATRRAIDSRTYSALGNAITIVQYELVPAEHRQAIPEYIRNLNSEVA